MLWQTETMCMHSADNDCIVCLSHAALSSNTVTAMIQRQFTQLFFFNNIIKCQQDDVR